MGETPHLSYNLLICAAVFIPWGVGAAWLFFFCLWLLRLWLWGAEFEEDEP
jgi:hypothetical protein